jgi:hypothetical protein
MTAVVAAQQRVEQLREVVVRDIGPGIGRDTGPKTEHDDQGRGRAKQTAHGMAFLTVSDHAGPVPEAAPGAQLVPQSLLDD